MNIIDEHDKLNTVMFNDLTAGDWFEYRGELYVKMRPIGNCTAFMLNSNRAWYFAYNTFVNKVDVDIIIKN